MFQSFELQADPSQGTQRLPLLREAMADHGVDGFLVPRADEHQGEYVPASAERLRWLTGFTGSAGAALVLKDRAIVFVDGRYTLQVRDQVDPSLFEIASLVEMPPAKWLGKNLPAESSIGYDPRLHTIAEAKRLRAACERVGGSLIAVPQNLVDAVWVDRPAAPRTAVAIQPLALAGETAADKIERLSKVVAEAGCDWTVLTDPASTAWMLNIRGGDVEHTPLALAFTLLPAEGRPKLFIDKAKLGIEARAYLTQLCDLAAPEALETELKELAASGARFGLDAGLAADWFRLVVEEASGAAVSSLADPARLPRACKNAAELAGTRAAHRRDGAAIARFLAWLDTEPAGSLDEIKAAAKLENCRRASGEEAQMPLRDISFDTISGAGPNGAIVHYRVTEKSNRTLGAGELYLVDSGGQYQDGTTDITRTVIIGGGATNDMRRHYTLVLKGLIAVSRLRFPAGTRGQDVDPFARRALWEAGLDFAHGTGHGVGAYLSVHEGPQRIAKSGSEPLLAGMILSNEPGYYRTGAYGIRLENLLVVEDAREVQGGDAAMHGFETLTLAPFDRRLIDIDLLEPAEIAWLDGYHARVFAEIGPIVEGEVADWLRAATRPLSEKIASGDQ